jgi:hypothetical protein
MAQLRGILQTTSSGPTASRACTDNIKGTVSREFPTNSLFFNKQNPTCPQQTVPSKVDTVKVTRMPKKD